ncbi:MAG: hypothetical protein WA994_11170 [Ornithinimicrobium sp.]
MTLTTTNGNEVLPGDLLFSHSTDNELAGLLKMALRIDYSHVGFYYGEIPDAHGRVAVSLDASPRHAKGEGVFTRPLRGLLGPTCSPSEAKAWSGVDEVAVWRHPAIARLAKSGERDRVGELGVLLCEAANRMTDYARDLIPILKEIDDPAEANYRFQHLADVLVSREVTPAGVRLALDEATQLHRLARALTSGYTCSAFVANIFLVASKRDPELTLRLGLPVGGVLTRQYKVANVPAIARSRDKIRVRFVDAEDGEEDLTGVEWEAYNQLLWELSEILTVQLPRPTRTVVIDYLAQGVDGRPLEREDLVYGELGTEIPRFLVGVHHLLKSEDLEAVGTLARGVPDAPVAGV